MSEADIVIGVFDAGSESWAKDCEVIFDGVERPKVLVLNKMDLFDASTQRLLRVPEELEKIVNFVFYMSCRTGEGQQQLLDRVGEMVEKRYSFILTVVRQPLY